MKKIMFGLIAVAFMGMASVNAQNSVKPLGYFSLDRLGFGKISSYAGPCVNGAGACMGTVIGDSAPFTAAIRKVSNTEVSLAFSKDVYQTNLAYLREGLTVGSEFSLPGQVTETIGVEGEFVVARGVYAVTQKDGVYYVSFQRR